MKISQYLVGRGFFCAVGVVEFPAGGSRTIQYGEARRSDSNNGVTVVYDESGAPWVRSRPVSCEERDWLLDHGVKFQSCYVPLSNGGDWLQKMEQLRDENAFRRMNEQPVATRRGPDGQWLDDDHAICFGGSNIYPGAPGDQDKRE